MKFTQLLVLLFLITLSNTHCTSGQQSNRLSNAEIEQQRERTTIALVEYKDIYNQQLQKSVSTLVVDEDYIRSADEGMQAVIAYYAGLAGTECNWQDGEPNKDYNNISCALLEPLGLGYQCSDAHKALVKKWFAEEPAALEKIDKCYITLNSAKDQTIHSFINIRRTGDIYNVHYKMNYVSGRSSTKITYRDYLRVYDDKVRFVGAMDK